MAAKESEAEPEPEQATPGDSSLPPEQEDRIVDRIFRKIESTIKDVVGPGEGGERRPPGSLEGSPTAPPGPAATEADMERRVRDQVDKEITAKERRSAAAEARAAHDAEHEKIRAQIEKPPRVYSRLTRIVWGSDDS